MFDVDKFVDEIESEFMVKIDRERCKRAYLDGAMTTYQFTMEQQGKDVTKEELNSFEKMIKEKLGLEWNMSSLLCKGVVRWVV